MMIQAEYERLVKWLKKSHETNYTTYIGYQVTKADVVRWIELLLEENQELKHLVKEAWSFPPYPAGRDDDENDGADWIDAVTELDNKIRVMTEGYE